MINFKDISEGFLNLAKKELGIADPEVEKLAIERYFICSNCEFKKQPNNCGKCGCFLPAKCRALNSTCPVKKW